MRNRSLMIHSFLSDIFLLLLIACITQRAETFSISSGSNLVYPERRKQFFLQGPKCPSKISRKLSQEDMTPSFFALHDNKQSSSGSRRLVLNQLLAGITMSGTWRTFSPPSSALATVESNTPSSSTTTITTSTTASSAISISDILLRLRNIPVFAIVNSDGIPYMIFDGSASATGYFFFSFRVAANVLEDARQKDKTYEKEWAQATIIVLPLTVALQLALRKTQRKAINYKDTLIDTFNDMVASEEGVEDAQLIDARNNPDRWTQKGRVPLFYISGLTVERDGRTLSPRYFNKLNLLEEWNRQHPDISPPTIEIVEMVNLYRNAFNKNELEKLANIILVPVQESNQVAAELRKRSTIPSYNLKDAILVGSSK